MASSKNVHHAHISAKLHALHDSLIDIVRVMNNPERDAAMVREAGIDLDRALFPLLVGIERLGPIGVVELANGVGRDYTTVSRQVAKLETLGLVKRQSNATDRRVTEAIATAKGKLVIGSVDAARDRIGKKTFASWSERDLDELVRLMRRFADAIRD
jgi:DNA-binding MarR family transcriptional regulator